MVNHYSCPLSFSYSYKYSEDGGDGLYWFLCIGSICMLRTINQHIGLILINLHENWLTWLIWIKVLLIEGSSFFFLTNHNIDECVCFRFLDTFLFNWGTCPFEIKWQFHSDFTRLQIISWKDLLLLQLYLVQSYKLLEEFPQRRKKLDK